MGRAAASDNSGHEAARLTGKRPGIHTLCRIVAACFNGLARKGRRLQCTMLGACAVHLS